MASRDTLLTNFDRLAALAFCKSTAWRIPMQFRHIRLSLASALALAGGFLVPSTAPAWAGATVSPPANHETGSEDVSNAVAEPTKNAPGRVANDDESPIMTKGLKVWITKGGSYCIREIAVDGKWETRARSKRSKIEVFNFEHDPSTKNIGDSQCPLGKYSLGSARTS